MKGGSDAAWLWYGAALLLLGTVAYGAGTFLRLAHSGSHALYQAYGLAAVLVMLGGTAFFVTRLQAYLARKEAEGGLAGLGEEFRVFGRVVLRRVGARPAVIDYLVVGPDRRLFPVLIDRSGSPQNVAAAARRAAETGRLLQAAVREGAVPAAAQIPAEAAVEPVVLELGRRITPAVVEGVWVGNPEHLAETVKLE